MLTGFGENRPKISSSSRHSRLPLGIADQIGDDVGVEQVTHDRSTGLGIGSEIGGKSLSSGYNVARTASSDLRGATSLISFSPSLRNDGVLAWKFKFTPDADSLISSVFEEFHLSKNQGLAIKYIH